MVWVVGYLAAQFSIVSPGLDPMELIALLVVVLDFPFKAPQEVQVPPAAAEFTISYSFKAHCLFLFNQVADPQEALEQQKTWMGQGPL